ncbi:hypothetical protein F2Q69_00049288 [Brassica cretica]|uniref:Peptidase M16 N-terminal domain-containing protein n=1 Tax=Brassica cretica TaxID=69181 RepID=A0A8S9PNK7_BRACR|nr:hypothetical protein F2Q69_00049288 [Brassica cretica]
MSLSMMVEQMLNYTASLRTNYHFDVNADCFYEALDRLSQFFIKPLMSADATVREINDVDSC